MFEAKRRGGGVTIFADEETVPGPGPGDGAEELADALRGLGQAPELWVRPQLCLETGTCGGAEVFARWRRPGLGVVGAQELFRLAERAELVKPLTRHLLDLALNRLVERDDTGPALTLSLPPQLLSEPQLVDLIAQRLAATGVDRNSLLLDFEESAVIAQGGASNPVLRRLTGLGLKISVSGLGGALSSLKFLRDFPLAELRIHPDLVSQVASNRPDARICGILFNLAECLNLRAVACGISDPEIRRRLQELGCPFGVGPAISRPMPLADFDEWRAQLKVLPLERRFSRAPSRAASRAGC